MENLTTPPIVPAAPGQPQPPPLTEWDALKQAGYWQRCDSIILFLILMVWVTMVFWVIFAHPSAINLIAVLLVNISLKLVWVITLLFRCSHFVLLARSDINIMPDAAARLAVLYLNNASASGRKT